MRAEWLFLFLIVKRAGEARSRRWRSTKELQAITTCATFLHASFM